MKNILRDSRKQENCNGTVMKTAPTAAKTKKSEETILVRVEVERNIRIAVEDKKYPESLQQYTGDILLVGSSYDKKEKIHQCVIEEWK